MDRLVSASASAALLGILAVAFLARAVEPLAVGLSELSAEHAGKLVRVAGEVNSIEERSGNYFISLCSMRGSRACVQAVVFEKTAGRMREKNLELKALKKGSRIAVEGVVRDSQSRGISLHLISPNAIEVMN